MSVFGIVILVSFLLLLVYVLYRILNYIRWKEYNYDIIIAENAISYYIVTKHNYLFIMEILDKIDGNDMDKERTKKIKDLFYSKYKSFIF